MELENLVEKVKNGDKDAYSKLIEYVHNDLYKFALSKLGNEADAQDALQETFINAYLSIHKLKDNKLFKSWITKILINECNHIYKNHKKKIEVLDKYTTFGKTSNYLEDNLSFQEMLDTLDETQKKIFSLYYEDRLSIKQIANLLHLNENTVKTALHRGIIKIKKTYKPATLLILILCVLITTTVIAVSIISYIKSLFEVNSIGDYNNNILTAIEHLDWFQETKMDYVDMNDDYKVKIEYLLLDEMNLYMVFDITSDNDVSKFTDIYFPDLKITNENGDTIYNEIDTMSENYNTKMSAKFIEANKNNIKVLVYMYTDSFPISRTLNIEFSRLSLLSKPLLGGKKFLDIDANVSLQIDLDEKFVNRNYIIYTSDNPAVEKAIITETGFYAIVSNNIDDKTVSVELLDENNNLLDCYCTILTNSDTSSIYKRIIISNFCNIDTSNLILKINDNIYNLSKLK